MSFPKYPAYKDSGIEWLGEIPAHWAAAFLRHGYEVVLGKMLQPDSKVETDEFLPYLRAANIQPSGVDIQDVRKMWFSQAEKKTLRLIKDDLLVSEGGDVGRSALWDFDQECYFQNAINRIRSLKGNSTSYLFYWMASIKQNGYIDVICNKSTIAHYTAEKVSATPMLLPPVVEQTQIAQFLDHETAKIDALIEEQKRLIELLKEKRQAVISQAVTKGLDPNVPMKDSGVEWLGDVPAHWNVTRLNYFIQTRKGFAYSSMAFIEEGVPVVKASDIKNHSMNEPSTFVDTDFLRLTSNAILKEGNVVFSTVGSTPDVRNSAVGQIGRVPASLNGALLNQNTVIFEPSDSRVLNEYLFYALLSSAYREHLDLSAHGTANQASLSLNDMLNFSIPLPPLDEQSAISSELSKTIERAEALGLEADRLVALLTQRRSALISAAVTGKIDVRGWQPPVSKQKENQMEAALG